MPLCEYAFMKNSVGDELWRDIIGYEGLYKVSDQGRVKSMRRRITRGGVFASSYMITERILKQTTGEWGYNRVCLHKDSKQVSPTVHKLVLIAFDRFPQKNEYCRHLNENRRDNRLINLIWKKYKVKPKKAAISLVADFLEENGRKRKKSTK